jgi:NADH:ubiquinone oxidoreductase subunit K
VIEEREVVTLLLGLGALTLAFRNRRSLSYLHSLELLLASLSLLTFGFASSILEGLPGWVVFDSIEHACYALSSLAIALWAYRTATR